MLLPPCDLVPPLPEVSSPPSPVLLPPVEREPLELSPQEKERAKQPSSA
jgi:hypothetical protein